MEQDDHIAFGPFRLDTIHNHLWRGAHPIALRPRSVAVLRYLAEHPGRLVTKAELHQHVWGGTHVTDTVLRVCIREIRAALGDSAAVPQYLETVGGQGYRFLVGDDQTIPPRPTAGLITGRQREVDTLERWFQHAATGERQMVFVSGEAGIGKTTVLDLFRARLAQGEPVHLGQGQCVESYGEGEPFLPLLEALGQLSRGPRGTEVIAALQRYAPMWLVQLPGLLGDTDLEWIQRQVQGATRARMVRELADVLQVLTLDRPLVLVLEDLHWSDPSTAECLASLAQRQEPARLLVLGTYRPVELVLRAHPLRSLVQELRGRGQAVELRLELLSAENVAAYVVGRLDGPVAAPLAAFVYERTEGNALFMVHLVEHLVQQGLVMRQGGQWTWRHGAEVVSLPEGVRQLLGRYIETLPASAQRVLETASVMGEAFAAVAVAAGAQLSGADVEVVCDALVAQQHFLDDMGLAVWPDGSSGGSYRFRHTLYQQVLYERLGSTRRAQLHRLIGARLEAAYGARAGEVAAQLAVHFELGRDLRRAVPYCLQAGELALRRHAYQEAIGHCTKGLEHLMALPETDTRTALALHLTLGAALLVTRGFAAPEVEQAHLRAYELCQQGEENLELGVVLHGLASFYNNRSEFQTALDIEARLLRIAQQHHHPGLLAAAHRILGATLLYRGDFVSARQHLEQSVRHAPTVPDNVLAALSSREGESEGRIMLAAVLVRLGYLEQARQHNHEALTLTQEQPMPFLRVFALLFTAIIQQFCRDVQGTREWAEAVITLATEQGFALFRAFGMVLHGWACAMQGQGEAGIAEIRQGLAAYAATGALLAQPYRLAMLADAYGAVGQVAEALTSLDEALTLVHTTGEAHIAAHLYWLKGKLLLAQRGASPETGEGEACLQQALDVARGQQARTLELRVAVSLSRLWQQQGKRDEARQLLAPIYGWFTEGFDTADLCEARALLEELH